MLWRNGDVQRLFTRENAEALSEAGSKCEAAT